MTTTLETNPTITDKYKLRFTTPHGIILTNGPIYDLDNFISTVVDAMRSKHAMILANDGGYIVIPWELFAQSFLEIIPTTGNE